MSYIEISYIGKAHKMVLILTYETEVISDKSFLTPTTGELNG